MIRGLQFKKTTVFGEERWCTEPWGDSPKDYIQQLNDIGLLLPSILEDLSTTQSREQIWKRCQNLEDRFNAWYIRLRTLFPTSPYWEQPVKLTARAADIPPAPFATAFNFLDIRVAEALTVFWALRIILHAVLRGFASARGVASNEGDTVIMGSACNIARSISYLTLPRAGVLGMQWIIFPLRTALTTFQKRGWEAESQWSKNVLVAVQKRGICYGGDIVDAQWGERIR